MGLLVTVWRGAKRLSTFRGRAQDDKGSTDPEELQKHPHDPGTGKFAKTGKVNSNVITPALKAHGMKLLKSAFPGYLATYQHHSSGLLVHIHHPPAGSSYSAKWTAQTAHGHELHGHGKTLTDVLAKETKPVVAAAPKIEVFSVPTEHEKLQHLLAGAGYEIDAKAYGGWKHPVTGHSVYLAGNGMWTGMEKGVHHEGSSTESLSKHLTNVVTSASPSPAPLDAHKNVLTAMGYSKTFSHGSGYSTWEHPKYGHKITLHENSVSQSGHVWQSMSPGGLQMAGDSSQSLNTHLSGIVAASKLVTPSSSLVDDPSLLTISNSGYVSHSKSDKLHEFHHPNGSIIKVEKTPAGNLHWTSASTGHQPKAGDNLHALQQLLTGVNPKTIKFSTAASSTPASAAMPNKPWDPYSSDQPNVNISAAGHSYSEISKAAPEPDSSEKNAIGAYSGSLYDVLNKGLRDGVVHPSASNAVTALDKYFARARIAEDTTLFRGVKSPFANKIAEYGVGAQYVDNGYSSHTTNSNTARAFASQGGALLIVKIPKGAQGAAIKAHSHHETEDEVLFSRGARFRVTHVDGAKRHIHLEMVL